MLGDKKTISINFSVGAILKTVGILLLIYFLFLIKLVLAILFVAFLVNSALSPLVDWLAKKKIPRALSAGFIYIFLLAIIASTIYFAAPKISQEISDFSKNSPSYLAKISSEFSDWQNQISKDFPALNLDNDTNGTNLDSLNANWQSAAGKIFSTAVKVFGGFLSFVVIMVMAFYMLAEENTLKRALLSVMPDKQRASASELAEKLETGVGRWLRGQLLLSLIIFTLVYVGLLILGVKYALVLAVFAAIAEFIPYLGPIISAVPAILIAFFQAPMIVFFVIIFYYILHWLEGHVIVPQVMGRAIGLSPVLIIAVMLAGFKLGGIFGAILAIPLTTALIVVYKHFIEKKKGFGV